MRPIDADRLLKTIANLDVECADQKQASIMLNTIRKVFPKIVNDEPTIEANPVKHGRWIDNGICDSMLSACSICGYSCGAYSFNYCPNCGSKNRMDGDSE